MARTVEGAGVPLVTDETGSGTPVLLVHDIAAGRDALPGVERARVIRYDRRGYGGSGAPEPYTGTTVNEQAEDAAAVLRALDASGAVAVGDGFGALVALDLALRHTALLRAVVVRDPPLFAFVPEANEELAEQRRVLQDAMATGGPEAAIARWLGPEANDGALSVAQASHRAFFADFAGLATWPVRRRDLRSIALPACVVTSPSTAWHVRRAADALADLLPAAQRRDDGDIAAAASGLL